MKEKTVKKSIVKENTIKKESINKSSTKNKVMKKKNIIIFLIIIILLFSIFIYFLSKNNYKTMEFGNNSNENIKEYILNLKSYEAEVSIEVNSNKNKNQYKIKQIFKEPNIFKQEVLEPTNVKGATTIYDGNTLKIENSSISLSKIYENYPYIANNNLCLYDFIQSYKNDENAKWKEDNNEIIMEVKTENIYHKYKKLYLDKKTGKPIKLEIQDINKKMLVYILYNEIKINSVNKEEILAFKWRETSEKI